MSDRTSQRHWRVLRLTLLVVLMAVMAGCANPIYKVTGDVLNAYSRTHATPYVLEMDDIRMACSLGQSVDPLLTSFERVNSSNPETGGLMQLLAGLCIEERAVEEELRYLRARYQDNSEELRDARTNSARLYGLTAQRRLETFNRINEAYEFDPAADELQCPCMRDDQDELTFMVGLLSGAQAVLDDAKARGRAGVSRSLAPQIERAASCLDNEKWAGIPRNIRAVIWVLLPDTRPADDIDPWQVMADNRDIAIDRGLRTAFALELAMAENVGNDEVIAESLAALAASEDGFELWEEYALVDLIGKQVALYVSDRVWTSNSGYRTPGGRFGRVDDTRPERDDSDIDDLL